MWKKTIAISTLISLLALNSQAFARGGFTPINTPTVDGKYVPVVDLTRDSMIEGYRRKCLNNFLPFPPEKNVA